MSYLIKKGCATRRIPDPQCPDFIEYRPGDIVETFPAHVPISDWIRDGVIAVGGEAEPRKAHKAK